MPFVWEIEVQQDGAIQWLEVFAVCLNECTAVTWHIQYPHMPPWLSYKHLTNYFTVENTRKYIPQYVYNYTLGSIGTKLFTHNYEFFFKDITSLYILVLSSGFMCHQPSAKSWLHILLKNY